MDIKFSTWDAVLFDLDGTLLTVDLDFPRMKEAVLQIAKNFGAFNPEMENMDILAIAESSQLALEQAGDAAGLLLREQTERVLSEIEIEAAREAREMDGAIETLNALAASNIPTAIVTRNCRAAVTVALQRVPLRVQVILARDDVPHPKPHRDHLLRALRRLGCSPENTLMVGDHWLDMMAGRNAGTLTAALLTPGRGEDWFQPSPPDHYLHSLRELIAAR